MSFINIYVYKNNDDNTIKIRVDKFSDSTFGIKQQFNFIKEVNSKYAKQSKQHYAGKNLIEFSKAFNKVFANDLSPKAKDPFQPELTKICLFPSSQDGDMMLSQSSIYTLTDDPIVILKWLTCFNVFLDHPRDFNPVDYVAEYLEESPLIENEVFFDENQWRKKATNHMGATFIKIQKKLLGFENDGLSLDTIKILKECFRQYKEEKFFSFIKIVNRCIQNTTIYPFLDHQSRSPMILPQKIGHLVKRPL